jgi:hypothetical protein
VTRRCIARLALAAPALASAGCLGGDPEPPAAAADAALRGGTLHVATEFPMFGGFDPVTESNVARWSSTRCCLLRTLMSYAGVQTPRAAG